VSPDTGTHEFAPGEDSGSGLHLRGAALQAARLIAMIDPMLALRADLIAGTVDRSELHIHDTAGLTRYALAAGVIESTIHLTIESRPDLVWSQVGPDRHRP